MSAFAAGSTGRRNTLSQAVKDETYDDGSQIQLRPLVNNYSPSVVFRLRRFPFRLRILA
jgi:hypothetical protein